MECLSHGYYSNKNITLKTVGIPAEHVVRMYVINIKMHLLLVYIIKIR
jgi:hypothetical protein